MKTKKEIEMAARIEREVKLGKAYERLEKALMGLKQKVK